MNSSGCQKLGETRKQFPLDPGEGTCPADALTLALKIYLQTSYLYSSKAETCLALRH